MWSNKEEAFANIVKGVKGALDDLRARVQYTGKPSSYWNVPYWRNPFFTGRGDVLVDLREAFTSPQGLLYVQALSGLAGVGKTQVAVEYACQYAGSYQAVLWVHADSPEILLSSFVTLAETLNLPEKNQADQPLIIASVKKWLQQHSHWLLIVDNLEDINLLQIIVPSPHSGHILVTTRSHRTGQIAHRVDLPPMSMDDGVFLLLRRANRICLSVHRLVQTVVKDTLSEEQQQKYRECVVGVIDSVFPSAEFSNWATCQRYLPQAQACIKLIQQHKIFLPSASQLSYRVGTYLTERGLYDEAEALLKQASVIEETLFGTDHPGIFPMLNALAKVYYKKGRYDLVEPISQRSLTLSERMSESDYPAIAEGLVLA